jgi:hypothetical protein
MEDYHLKLIHLIKLEILIGNKIYHTMGHYVICCGLILPMMAKMGSIRHLEVLDIAGVKISVISLCIEII